LPPLLVAIVALALAAAVLFALPGLLGFGSPSAVASPTPSVGPSVGASLAPTAVPAPTPQVYVVRSGDTMSSIAKKFGLALAHLTRDHLQAGLRAQEPAADLLDATKRPRVVADVDAHLDALVHERDRGRAIAIVELLEEVFHRVDGTHCPNSRRGPPSLMARLEWILLSRAR